MGRKRKDEPTPEQRKVRTTLAANLAVLIEHEYARFRSPTRRYQELARALQTSLSQVQRLMIGAVGTSVDQLADLAKLFHIDAWELLNPSFGARYARNEERLRDRAILQRQGR